MKSMLTPALVALLLATVPAKATAARVDVPSASAAFEAFLSKGPHGTVKVHLNVLPGFAIYRDKIQFEATGGRVASVSVPAGTVHDDPYVGRTELLTGMVTIAAHVQALRPAEPVVLRMSYMGCMVNEFCYPPQRLEFDLGTL